MEHNYIPGSGSMGAKLMLLIECPSLDDNNSGRLLSKSRELDMLLRENGINKGDCWITSVSKYYVPPNDSKKKIPFPIRAKNIGIDIPEQLSDLQNEINSIKPNCILGIGKTALWAMTGKLDITSYRGSILQGMGRKFVGTYNPDHLNWHASDIEFKGYWNRQLIAFDIRRAFKQQEFPEIIRPQRQLQICHNSYELSEFINKYKNDSKLSVDIEAHGTCIPACMGLAFNPRHGMTVPLWNCDGISSIPDSDLVQIWTLLAQLLWEKDIIGQNFNYDRDKIKRLGFVIRSLVGDTMLKAFAINPELPKSLGFNTSIYTEEPFYKNEGMYQGSPFDLQIGCARDACVTYEINDNMDVDLNELGMGDYYRNFLLKLPEMYWAIENQGFAIDKVARDELLRKYIEWDEQLRYKLFQLTGTEINVNSPKQIAILLFDNLKLPRKNGTGEEEITTLLNSPKIKEEHRDLLETILEDRRVRKSISTYLMAMPDYDGRMRTTYFPCLETGRTSTGQQDPPIRPTVDVIDENGKKKTKVLGTAFQTLCKHGDVGQDVRRMFIPG